ncbi:uncharacterized protein LOC113554109 isoform X2 [Rhopalosiphum maidis]|uniref:uncharacterized protein LOC113554109 isoform X2 n=1 Tax=Rhopalosiphum maidis TaxID=43146 RepID=UPI000EFFD7F6|nr:uncharacterized protein LOC113554109 isoform X2 [Rhopalosiphum maidis]
MNFFKRYFITITITVLPIFIISSTACPPYIRTYLNDFEGVSGNFNRRNAVISIDYQKNFGVFYGVRTRFLDEYCMEKNHNEYNIRSNFYGKIFRDSYSNGERERQY